MLSVVDWSRGEASDAGWEDKLRERVAGVDAVVVICGEHTEKAFDMNREFGIIQEENKPYVLLWGRRTGACTKPVLARRSDCFYTWIWDILSAQVFDAVRRQPPTPNEDADLAGLRVRRS
jgi:hypothetical protein